jgi:hypothetical protein
MYLRAAGFGFMLGLGCRLRLCFDWIEDPIREKFSTVTQ